MLWILLIAAAALISFWYYYIKPLNYWSNLGVKQSSKSWPMVGDMWPRIFRRKSFGELVLWLYNMHPNERYCGFYQQIRPVLLIKDPELIKQITIKDFDHFTDHRSLIDPEVDHLWSGNLFSLKGQEWREMRATLSGTFTSSKMKTIFNLMTETTANFVQYFLDKDKDLIELELKDCYTRYTNDVIATAAFGIEVNSLREPENTFYLMGKEITDFFGILKTVKFIANLLLPTVFKFFKISLFDRNATNYFKNVIEDAIKTREDKGIVRPDMINLLLETRNGIKREQNEMIDTGYATIQEFSNGTFKAAKNLTNNQIVSQALVFFFAGFNTVSVAMCFGSYELALNESIQQKLRDEIMKTDKGNNGKITYDALLNMKYLDMVISEILRKWPPAVTTDRICTKPYTIEPVNADEKPVHLEKGQLIWLPFHGIHRNPNFYPNPNLFDPDRFSLENKEKIKPYTYLPFGSGPRACIGSRFALLELKVLFYKLLLNFELVITEKTPIPLILNRKSLDNTAENGFWLGFKRIKTLQ